MPDLKNPVVFFRHKDGLGLRHAGGLTVNGQKVPERTFLGPRAWWRATISLSPWSRCG